MRELTLRVAAGELEEVLDAVLPALPGGVHMGQRAETVELRILDTPGTPAERTLVELAGASLLESSSEEVSDDWRERRLARYEPLVIADRFLIRPDWAPPADRPDLLEIVLGQSSAFGTGVHPTTQACLAMLAEIEPGGSLADCGCGSGVLSIAAARLGWSPIFAVDVSESTVAAARGNISVNHATVDVLRLDLTCEEAPVARTVLANVPPPIHSAISGSVRVMPEQAIVSGFHPEETEGVAEAWERAGLTVADETRASDWVALLLAR